MEEVRHILAGVQEVGPNQRSVVAFQEEHPHLAKVYRLGQSEVDATEIVVVEAKVNAAELGP